jgi:hypothetical protein
MTRSMVLICHLRLRIVLYTTIYSTTDHPLTENHISCGSLIVPHSMESRNCVYRPYRKTF